MSKKICSVKYNYKIYSKEFLAIIQAFEEQHLKLTETPIEDLIYVIINPKNLKDFLNTKDLNKKQAQQANILAKFNFWITYRLKKSKTKPVSLTQRPKNLPQNAFNSCHFY